ncbi:MAG TPA: DUF4157 domain-containing protein [Chloroflexia bacterium]|nr:DUF4157 domain-containing protein [Chloroflexia bacterium]
MDDSGYESDRRPGALPDPDNPQSWIEQLIGRSLGDVRVHDSTQAGELAARLGARAFAAGRHVYARPELLRPMTPRSVALLAHEMTHAAEQSGAPPAPGRPLSRPAGPAPGPRPAVQRAIATAPAPEASALGAEAQALAAQQDAARPPRGGPVDPQAVADRLYDRLVGELRVDRERQVPGW